MKSQSTSKSARQARRRTRKANKANTKAGKRIWQRDNSKSSRARRLAWRAQKQALARIRCPIGSA
jgi:hypothetical protein